MVTRFNEYGEIEETESGRNENVDISDLLKDVLVVNFKQEYGIDKNSYVSRMSGLGDRLVRYFPTFVKVYSSVKEKISNYLASERRYD